MANNTLADYRSDILGMVQEDRDAPSENAVYRPEDIKRAINACRRRMIREVGVGLYRTSAVTDATAGAISVPADFFNDAVIRYAPDSNQRTTLKPITGKFQDERDPSWSTRTAGMPNAFSWEVTPDGVKIRLHPEPSSTVTGGLLWSYTAMLDDLEDDADECPIMNMFPEFQQTTLQAGALSILTLLEGGEADDQYQKFTAIFEREVEKIRSHINRLFVSQSTITGGR